MKTLRTLFALIMSVVVTLGVMTTLQGCKKDSRDTEISIEVLDVTDCSVTLKATGNCQFKFKSIIIDVVPNIIERLNNPYAVKPTRKFVNTYGDTFEATFDNLTLGCTYYFMAEFQDSDYQTDGPHYYSKEISVTTNDKKTFDIPDENFRNYVVAKYGSGGTITDGQARAVEELDLSNLGIKKLQGLEHFRNIKTLNLDGNLMDSLDICLQTKSESLSEFPGYTELKTISSCCCPNLSYLKIWSEKKSEGTQSVDTIKAHGNLKLEKAEILIYELRYLNLNDCNLKNIQFLTGEQFTSCVELSCNNNQLENINIDMVRYLYCSNNKFKSATFASSIWELDISNNELTYLSLANHPSITMDMLHCQNNPNLKEVIIPNEYFGKNIEDLNMDAQTKFVW